MDLHDEYIKCINTALDWHVTRVRRQTSKILLTASAWVRPSTGTPFTYEYAWMRTMLSNQKYPRQTADLKNKIAEMNLIGLACGGVRADGNHDDRELKVDTSLHNDTETLVCPLIDAYDTRFKWNRQVLLVQVGCARRNVCC
jgi:hypothetical protein